MTPALFDSWTDTYDQWFQTPSGKPIKDYETRVLLDLLAPRKGEILLDVGCGTGIFTWDVLAADCRVTGVDLSAPMLERAVQRLDPDKFSAACSDMCALPFKNDQFDKAFSMTAIEFVKDAQAAVNELLRVTKKGGSIVVTTLNSLSSWADRRTEKAKDGHPLFEQIYFRSPDQMRALVPSGSPDPVVRTAVHFEKETPVEKISAIEEQGNRQTPETGAFLAVQFFKP